MPDCFIIMPITTPEDALGRYGGDCDHFLHVLEHLFCPAIEQAGLTPIPPIADGADLIHAKIIESIEKADLVLCDMSCLNPNVFFELGIRTALDLPVCMVQDDVSSRVPFDTGVINYQKYSSGLAAWTLKKDIADLSEHIQKSYPEGTPSNPMWQYFGITKRAHAHEDSDPTRDDRLEYLAVQVEAVRKQIEAVNYGGHTIPRVYLNRDTLHKKRLSEGLSHSELAGRAGLSDAAEVEVLETRHGPIRLEKAMAIAGALDCPIGEILLKDIAGKLLSTHG